MDIDKLIRLHPRLYHMAESGSWDSIQEYGLLSTSAILDLFEYSGEERYQIESNWRPKSITIKHPVHGKVVIRDQAPIPPEDLKTRLIGISIREWYELINSKIFFWVSKNRLDNFLNAINYRNRSHTVLTISTRNLLSNYINAITLTDINTGFIYFGGTRGKHTFRSIEEFPANRTVWELVIEYAVYDVTDVAITVEEWKRDRLLEVIWKR